MRTLFSHRYILTLILGMLAVQAIPCAAQNGSTDDIKLFKRTEPTGNNDEYRITLESFVTGRAIINEITKPVDLMLALDVSTSMAANCQGNPGAWTLTTFEKLTTGDHLKDVLHTNTSGDSNYSAVENNTLRYRIQLAGENMQRNLLYHNGKWYYSDTSTRTSWSTTTGRWTEYIRNNANDIVLTDVKIDLLQEACRVFLAELRTQSLGKDGIKGTTDDVDIRVGISTYCGQLMTDNNYNIVPISNDTYYSALLGKINNLHNHMNGSTDPSMSFDDIKNNKYPTLNTALVNEGKSAADIANRAKVVVMFTDGKPQDGTHGNDLNYLINSAHNLKTMGAKLYTIGIFKENPTDVIRNGVTIEQYMLYLSSEYPDATGYNNGTGQNTHGNRNTEIQYYYPDTGAKLSEIFQSIAQSAGADTYTLTNSDAAAIDVMSDDFTLPSGMLPSAVTIRQWFCTGTTNEEDSDPDANTKIRGGYVFKLITKNTSTGAESCGVSAYNGKIHADSPYCFDIIDDPDTGEQRVIVRGFDYSVDDVYNSSNVLTTYGNWVGMHGLQKNTPAGKMLEFSFLVKLKPESMGGFGLPSNKISSGIYKNTGSETNPEYTQIVAAYPKPLVNVPSIYILKQGLNYGESAVFTVTRTTDATGKLITASDTGYIQYKVILSQTGADGADCFAVIKSLDAGKYKVEENTDWSWTYTPATGFATSQERDLHTPNSAGFADMAAFKTDIQTRQNGADYGKTSITGWDAEANRYYVTGNLTKDDSGEETDDNTSLHLLFKFVNSKKNTALPLNDEAFTVNVFGTGGGSAEHGGVDPEVEL